jgi:hypothetical protein
MSALTVRGLSSVACSVVVFFCLTLACFGRFIQYAHERVDNPCWIPTEYDETSAICVRLFSCAKEGDVRPFLLSSHWYLSTTSK